MAESDSYLLGIDLGTSTVKAVLVQRGSHVVIKEHSEPTLAQKLSSIEGGDEQDVILIIGALERVMGKFSQKNLRNVTSVGICGQMHGIVLWKNGCMKLENGHINHINSSDFISHLITWQDNRCNELFLSSLPQTCQPTAISSGYGCATLFWYQKYQPDLLKFYNKAGTIMDLIVCILCGLSDVIMTSQNATSWGYFDNGMNKWEIKILSDANFPTHFLPKVVSAPVFAGGLVNTWFGIPAGVSVSAAMGDLQCSVHAVQPELDDAVLNIGSASQLSIINPSSTLFNISVYPALTEVPYFNNTTLLVAAALTGGNAIAKLVKFFRELLNGVNVSDKDVNDQKIYSYLINAARHNIDTTLVVNPIFLGERHQPNVRGHVTNIGSDNLCVGDVSSALMKGIVENLKEMMPSMIFEQFRIKRIIGSGSTLHKNPVLVEHVVRCMGLPVVLRANVDSPLGAAISMEV